MERSKIEAFAGKARNLLKQQIGARIALLRKSESSSVVIENKSAMATLEKRISDKGLETVIDEVAYTWFNRLCALRYMDAHDFNKTLIVTPLEGNILPEILSDAMTGNLDSEILTRSNEDRIKKLLSGEVRSNNAQAEIYRILLVSKCNALNKDIPMLFERISDYTDLLLPEDLLSKDAIIPMMREALTDENCETVEVIGWLYQYYIAEKKDEVFAGFKKGKKATAKEIPAATQLFTPEWIVRYLVENSLGRLWMLNHPESRLIEKMEYYIKPVDVEPDFIKIASPEEIKVCDPCCGSGHMLTYSFDILFEIYSELGYTAKDAVEHIIRDNLYGIEIDDRAGQLAYFALMMKAREKARRFFSLGVEPNICVLHNVLFDEEELRGACSLFSNTRYSVVRNLLTQFEHADIFGSLIVPFVDDIAKLKANLTKTTRTDDLFDVADTIESRVNEVLRYADYLSSKYQVVITNPPYMGSGNMCNSLKDFAVSNYTSSKADLFSMFIDRTKDMVQRCGYFSLVTMQSWMFLSSFNEFRKDVLSESTICCLAHLDNMVMRIAFGTSATIFNKSVSNRIGQYCYVGSSDIVDESPAKFPPINKRNAKAPDGNCLFTIQPSAFNLIPNTLIAYWLSPSVINCFAWDKLSSILITREGMATADNDRFLRYWYEPFSALVRFPNSLGNAYWIPYNKGGAYRKWYGNNDYVVFWKDDGFDIKNNIDRETGRIRSHNYNGEYGFLEGMTWSALSSSDISLRYCPEGFLFDSKGAKGFTQGKDQLLFCLALCNSVVARTLLEVLSPTMDFKVGDIVQIPYPYHLSVNDVVSDCISLAKNDWDSFETSWDFLHHPFVKWSKDLWDTISIGATMDKFYGHHPEISCPLELCFMLWQGECDERFNQLKANEEELNRIFIDIYGLQDELTPEEDDSDVTVRKADLNRDMRSFISYAVGCMLGRYSLDVSGLAYAGGSWDSSKYTSFIPDEDNVIPVLTNEWFSDDIAFRFREFVKVVFGEETLVANMKYVEDSLGMSIRNYFTKEFYKDHLKVYQKRPIYWMFSSPKGYFNALVYLHRYNENTPSVVLSYLRKFRDKLATEIGALERENNSKNAKKLVNYKKMVEDLDDYEHILYPIAMENISLDLDDGVKVNYAKLGDALKKVSGLEKIE